jgi:hypothetical protein
VERIPITYPRTDAQYFLGIWKTDCGKVVHYPYFNAVEDDRGGSPRSQWGFSPERIPLSELSVLERHQSATVIVTDDAWLAWWINRLLHIFYEGTHEKLVATAFWAGVCRLSNYALSPLQGRDVVYIPTLHKESLAVGVELNARLESIGVESFRVLMKPFANSEAEIEAARTECGNYACDNALVVSNANCLRMLDEIPRAWSIDRFKRFCQQERLIELQEQEVKELNTSLFRSAADINAEDNGEIHDGGLTFGNIFAPSNITVIVGGSDVGKSVFARTLAVAIADNKGAFGIEASGHRDVYILNAEQDHQKTNAYTKRAMSALGIIEIPKRLFDRPDLSMSNPDGLGPLNILDLKWQEAIFATISFGSVLFIDNILSTSHKGLNHPNVAQQIRHFAKRLQEKHVSLVIIHHTGKDSEPMGSAALESLCQNFILMHPVETRVGFEGGVNAQITFRKIKGHPLYKGKVIRTYLKYSDTCEDHLPWVLEEVDNGGLNDVTPSTPPREKPNIAGLHEIEQDALLHAYEHGRVTRKEVKAKGYNDETVKDHLQRLADLGMLIRHGAGRGVFYAPPEPGKSQ